jgi:uncharacterized membrane protein YgcG
MVGDRRGIAFVLGALVAALMGNALYGLAAGGVVLLVAVSVEIFFYLDRDLVAHGGIHWEGSRAHAAHSGGVDGSGDSGRDGGGGDGGGDGGGGD